MQPQSSAPAGSVSATYLELSRLALALDETIDPLEAWHLSDEEADLLSVPVAHLRIALGRLAQVVHEAEALDQAPRLARLRSAA